MESVTDKEIEDLNHDPATAVKSRHLIEQKPDFSHGRLKDAIQILIKLSGVGPATASLILSVYDPHNIPFFSDELARWCSASPASWEIAERDDWRPHPCWKLKLKYNLDEYFGMYDIIARHNTGQIDCRASDEWQQTRVSCMDLEKAAWVFCREDALPEDQQESVVEQQFAFTLKSAAEQAGGDTNKMGQLQGHPKRKSTEDLASEAPEPKTRRSKS